ncbi:hypothetical protein KZZ52_31520 [Dactylosporangium sp. AC04546]|uniref:hypothetical protein n=1 Tax=Dactylosporangium sp. AC04546 TaxID=2862460 RepID=UPI001EDCA24C|nr:hypothetical protein [Dactylosporangium sp. AC04546]WVK78523.1 hypothetical protein KZZ52_31520 [Dactylosporangium sp. AC04546]
MWTLAVALTTVLSGVAINQVLNNGNWDWRWLAAAIAVVLAGGLVAKRLPGPTGATAAPDHAVDVVERELAGLATAVAAVWKPDQSRRRLLNPRPLPTAWHSWPTPTDAASSGKLAGSGSSVTPYSADRLATTAEEYPRPRRRPTNW